MVGIQGLGGIPEPKSERVGKVRGERENAAQGASEGTSETSARDDVSFSSEAKTAAEAGRIMQLTRSQDDVRLARIEAAKERIAEGQYKNREVVAKVAEHLIKLLG